MIYKIKSKYSSLPIQLKASFWFLVCTFAQKAMNLITTPIFTRLLTTEEYGQYNIYTSWLSIFTVFISLNLSLGVFMRGLLKFKEQKNEFTSSMQFLTFVLVVCWMVIYLPISKYVNNITNLNTIRTLLMIVNIWLTSVYGFWAAEQRVDFQYKKLVPITLLVTIMGQVLGIILINYLKDKVMARILGIVIIDFIVYIWLFAGDLIRGKKLVNLKFWKYALLFNIPLIPHYLSQVILNSTDKIMIERMVGNSAVGIYSLAYSISQVMTMFNTALAQTEEPWLYRKVEDKKIDEIKPIAYMSFCFIAIVNLILILFAPEIIRIFAPETYYDAIWVIPPIAMSVFFSFSYFFFAIFEYYYEKTKNIAIASCIGAILNIVLNYWLIPIFGYYAAGYTTLFCFIIYAILHYLFMRKICIDKLEGKMPFSIKIYIAISTIFITLGFLFQLTYKFLCIRLFVLAIIIILFFIKKKNIINLFKTIKNHN